MSAEEDCLRSALQAAERQIDRLQRGNTIESDFITKNELRLEEELTKERFALGERENSLRLEQEIRAGLVARAEAAERGRDEARKHVELMAMGLIAERDAARADAARILAEAERGRLREDRAPSGGELQKLVYSLVRDDSDWETSELANKIHAGVAKLLAALEFYADSRNWFFHDYMDGEHSAVDDDQGQRAREALGKP